MHPIVQDSEKIVNKRIYWGDYSYYTKRYYFSSWEEFVDSEISLTKAFPHFLFLSGIWWGWPWRNDGYCSLRIVDRGYEYMLRAEVDC